MNGLISPSVSKAPSDTLINVIQHNLAQLERQYMTAAKEYWLNTIWGGSDPYANVDKNLVDMQGWASDNIYLTHAIEELRPRVVVEIGVWKAGLFNAPEIPNGAMVWDA